MHSKEYISLRITMWVSKLSKCSSSIYCPPDGSQVQGCSRKKQKTPWVQTQFDSRKIAHIPFFEISKTLFSFSLVVHTLLPSKAAIAPTKIPVFCKCSQHEPKTSDCVYKKHIFLPLFTCCFGIH